MNYTTELALEAMLQNPLKLFNVKSNKWNWNQLITPTDFEWIPGQTPFSDFGIVMWSWVFYFVTIIGIKMIMKNKEPFKLKSVTAIHNLGLCIGSLAMLIAGTVGLWNVSTERGLNDVFCTIDDSKKTGLLYWSLYIYYLSKFPELIDTVILALKKKPVIFLHWYHHSIVILLTWVWMEQKLSFGVFGLMLNTLVHVFMYYYYYKASFGQKVWYKKYITTGQILQFVSLFLLASYYMFYAPTVGCREWGAFYLSLAINSSFLILFLKFYRKTYKPTKSKLD